jgi:hypothetical protein
MGAWHYLLGCHVSTPDRLGAMPWTNLHTSGETTIIDYVWFHYAAKGIPTIKVNNSHWKLFWHVSCHAILFTEL